MKRSVGSQWWGTYRIEEGKSAQWRIGPSYLWIERRQGEWVVAHKESDRPDAVVSQPHFEQMSESIDSFNPLTSERFVAQGRTEDLQLQPALADRAVVTSPKQPVHIMPRTEVTIFASTPLWVQVSNGTAIMLDTPVDRPSDTWFGPTSDEGELCYATRVSCRLRLEAIETPPHRAVTAMSVNNDTDFPLHLRRVKLPVTHLELYAALDGRIWTEDVTLIRNEPEEDFATVELAGVPPRYADKAEKLAGPRQTGGGGMVMRAFGSLFSLG